MEKSHIEGQVTMDELVQEKRKENEQRAERAKRQKLMEKSSPWFSSEPLDPEAGRSAKKTSFNLPLFSSTSMEGGFLKFNEKTLANELHDLSNELIDVAILSTYAMHTLFRAAHKEAKMLADKEKYHLLAWVHEKKMKELEANIAMFEEVKAKIMLKAENFETLDPIFEQCTFDLENECHLRHLSLEMYQGERLKLTLAVIAQNISLGEILFHDTPLRIAHRTPPCSLRALPSTLHWLISDLHTLHVALRSTRQLVAALYIPTLKSDRLKRDPNA